MRCLHLCIFRKPPRTHLLHLCACCSAAFLPVIVGPVWVSWGRRVQIVHIHLKIAFFFSFSPLEIFFLKFLSELLGFISITQLVLEQADSVGNGLHRQPMNSVPGGASADVPSPAAVTAREGRKVGDVQGMFWCTEDWCSHCKGKCEEKQGAELLS